MKNYFYRQVARALNSESFQVPTELAFSSTNTTTADGSSTMVGEFDRVPVTSIRVGNTVDYVGVRIGSTVENINSIGLFSDGSSPEIMVDSLVPDLLHSTTFDVEVRWKINVGD